MNGKRTKLSVNFPIGISVICMIAIYFLYIAIRGQFSFGDPNWVLVPLFIVGIALTYLYIKRFWFSPVIRFNEEGIFIKPFRQPEVFVPFKDVMGLEAVGHFYEVASSSKHKQFNLFYRDAYGSVCRIRFMLHYFRQLFDSQLPLHSFLKCAKEANREFVFDHEPFYGPHH